VILPYSAILPRNLLNLLFLQLSYLGLLGLTRALGRLQKGPATKIVAANHKAMDDYLEQQTLAPKTIDRIRQSNYTLDWA